MATSSRNNPVVPIAIIGMMFFVFGFATWINAILIPYLKIACQLTNFEAYFVTFAFYISYLIFSVPVSYLLKRTGFQKGMLFGFWMMALGAFVFIPAALTRTYAVFLTGLFIIGIGLSILQTAANPYVTVLGAKNRAAQRISIMGICNKSAGILAPLLLAAFILKPGDAELFRQIPMMDEQTKSIALDAIARRVILPYSVVGVILILLGLLVRYSPLPDVENFAEGDAVQVPAQKKNIFQYPHLILGAVAIFLHVGTQVIAIDTIINYAQGMGLSLVEAKVFPSYTLSATIFGYLVGITIIPRVITQLTVLRICACLGLVFSIMILVLHGQVSVLGHHTDISIWFLALLGLANSMIWAGIWPLSLDGLGTHLKLGASVLVMGLSGNAILPLIYGFFADQYSLRSAYVVLLPCYLFLCFYAFYGYRVKRWSLSN